MADAPPPNLTLVGASLLVVGMGQALVFAVVPPAARHLGLNETEIAAIFSISALFWMGMSPVWGRWSDRVGRRRVLILGLVGYALSLSLFASALQLGQTGALLAALWPLLMLARVINGTFGSATRPAALGYVADSTSPSVRAPVLARVESGFTIGTVLGPAIGSLLLIYSLLAPFYLFAALGLVMAVLCLLLLDERSGPRPTLRRAWLSPLDVRVRPRLLTSAMVGISNATILLCFAFYLEDVVGVELSLLAFHTGMGLTMAAAGSVFAQWVLVPNFSIYPKRMVKVGALLIGLAMASFALGTVFWHAAIAMGLYGLGFGLIRPGNATLLSLSVRPKEQGSAAGLVGMVIPIGHLLTPVLSMPLYIWNPRSPFWLGVAMMLLLMLLMQLHPMFKRSPWQLRDIEAR